MKAWCGVDVGASGAAVAILEDGTIKMCRFNTATDKDIWLFFEALSFDYDCKCVVELVHSMPGDGSASAFSFGDKAGFIRGCLVAASIPFIQKTPQTWMKFYSMKREIVKDPVTKKETPNSESKTDFKRRLKSKAEQLYPQLKITNDVADAVLIANFAKVMEGQIQI